MDQYRVPDGIAPLRNQPLFYIFRRYVGRGAALGKTFKADV
jgi:hypothetical protein